jgi:peptidoglycan/xylan/chitin deacetylase (PgdA/CDA1 family)
MNTKQLVKSAVFTASKYVGLFRLSRYLIRNRLMILCYHGFQIADEAGFRPELFMRPDLFLKRMLFIKRNGFPVLTLQDALIKLKDGTLPANAVVITIDDGFFSVLDKAAPVLKRFNFPATLYVTSYYVSKETPIFRIVIQYMFWKTQERTLELSGYEWIPARRINLDDRATFHQVMWDIIDYGEREYDEVGRQGICKVLAGALKIDYGKILGSRMFNLVTQDELKETEAHGLDVQLHTHRHLFPIDDEAEARREIEENKQVLSRATDKKLVHFCYPSGIWDKKQWSWLDSMGIKSATTCKPGLNDTNTHKFALQRFLDSENISEIEFLAEISGFASMLRGMRIK